MDCQELINADHASLESHASALSSLHPIILLVEDERLVREVAGEVLKSAGYGVFKAASAAEALQFFEQNAADIQLLITDVVLPDDRGPELASKLNAAGGSFRTILISGYPERMIAKGRGAESAFFYLAKPFSAETLIRKVQQILSTRQMCVSAHWPR